MSSFSIPFYEAARHGSHELFMRRCLHLAALGAGQTAPNPMVGAVLVYGDRIIGEGFHEKYGGPHAEVHCIRSVKAADQPLISESTLYVSLEPCAHHGKTPPCADLIVQHKIPRVVIGCRDPFPEVDGKGIEKLLSNQVELIYPLMEAESIRSNRRFFTFHQQKRPYIVLKWAESANHRIAGRFGDRIKISNDYTDRLVHQWRSEEAGILVGTRTALLDDPELTTRLWPGKNPVRIVLDRNLRLPKTLKLFDGSVSTIILNEKKESQAENPMYKKIKTNEPLIPALLSALYSQQILSVLVEGGAALLQSFIDSGIWDEARIISNHQLDIMEGLAAPLLSHGAFLKEETCSTDTISYYRNNQTDNRKI
jgi:diaminohydroxyphosphoribosylaminopyrimidine deaminase/5-amino-6-(5-phosphoribosylamino)uracil reductase